MTKDAEMLQKMANSIRFLSIDAVQRANSGHPGMPMGMADVATVLFAEFLRFDALTPKWPNRDRFVLSAGHGSMLLYSLLYLSGYEDISIEDIKKFRQIGSKTAGHPEYGELAGIETTTGPLGQGLANAVGMALAAKMAGEEFTNKTYCIAGDGCLMEGISQEAISFAGHLGLDNLVVLWDDNSISIDGDISLTSSEDMRKRFEACGWEVLACDGHDFDSIRGSLKAAQNSDKPVMIACKTVIGFGSPNKAGSEKVHGAPLGDAEIAEVRQKLNWEHAAFEIPEDILAQWREVGQKYHEEAGSWQGKTDDFGDFADKMAQFKREIFAAKPSQATRKSSLAALEFLTRELSCLVGGSADLTGSVLTRASEMKSVAPGDFTGSYIHYGIREHAMAAMMNGMALFGGFVPYGGTFLVFSDYLKPAIRLSALMKQQVLYVFTHDSIGLGEDGPTHQPIEHLAMLRAIPGLRVFRPADAFEVVCCYEEALKYKDGPSALVLTRQNVEFLPGDYHEGCAKGAYVVGEAVKNPDVVIIATGSEVGVALAAQKRLKERDLAARVVTMPCVELFEEQDQAYKDEILGGDGVLRVSVEAALSQGWERYIGRDGIFIGMDSFGASGKAEDLFEHFGITADNVVAKIIEKK